MAGKRPAFTAPAGRYVGHNGVRLKSPLVFLIAAATGSQARNAAFGIKLPLLGYPSMSLPVLAALTPERFRVRLVDEGNEPVPYGQGCGLALIIGHTHTMPNAYRIADRLRAEGTAVVLGGMHASALPEEALGHADAVIIGEGESIWQDVLRDYEAGALRQRYHAPPADLAALPVMRRDLFNKKFYYPGEIIETTRGCPVGCLFCGVQKYFGAQFRARPPEAIRQELLSLFGPRPAQAKWKNWLARTWHPDIPYFIEKRLLYVMDSNFVSDPRHARDVLQVFKECDIRWYGHASLNLMRDEAILDLLAESGCMGVNIGFESLDQATIDAMHKRSNTTAEYAGCIRRLHDRGIGVMGTFIVGFDEDGPDVFERLGDFILENRLETAFVLILTPLPGTEIQRRMQAEGRILSTSWLDYDHGTVTFMPKRMTPLQLHEGMRSVWRRVYSLRSIWHRIMTGKKVRPFFYLPMNLGFYRCTRLICSEKLWPAPGEFSTRPAGDSPAP